MTNEANDLTLRYLRRLDEKADRLLVDIADLNHRMGALGTGWDEDKRGHHLAMMARFDRVEASLERIGQRLDERMAARSS